MSQSDPVPSAERDRLVFGAGFAFGVMVTMLILAVVVSTVAPRQLSLATLFDSRVLLPIAAAILLTTVVGIGLYSLSLPERGFELREFAEREDPELDRE